MTFYFLGYGGLQNARLKDHVLPKNASQMTRLKIKCVVRNNPQKAQVFATPKVSRCGCPVAISNTEEGWVGKSEKIERARI